MTAQIALLVPLYLWVFWYAYVLVMGLYRAHLDKRLGPIAYVLAAPVLVVGFALDVIANATIAWIVFLDRPRELLVTRRLKRYMAGRDSWRQRLAHAVCSRLLDPFDPTGRHC